MDLKKRRLSSLVESQLPGFITSEYENFGKFVEKYYEQQESTGQPLDIVSNLGKYRDIDTYEKNLLKQSSNLVSNISADSSTLELVDASSFPEENGYIKIGEEILFYQSRTNNVLEDVSRGVSGNTTLGDLYSSSRFVTTSAAPHYTGDVVYNISNLFLYALVKEFEKTYLSSFPEAYLKEGVDKRILIKNITKFYKSKGTDRSIKFIFNSIISKETDDIPEVVNPKDFVLKSSTSDWTKDYFLSVKIIQGDPQSLVGQVITQQLDPYNSDIQFASAVVDNVFFVGNDEYDDYYKLILEPATINGEFGISGRTTSIKSISASDTSDDRITVVSTMGFPQSGRLLIGDEIIIYKDKTVNQFIIDERVGPIRNHSAGKNVYSYLDISSDTGVRAISLGMVYNFTPKNNAPYSLTGENLEVSPPGFTTLDPIIRDNTIGRNRWLLNTTGNLARIKGVDQNFTADVEAIFEDEQYYYIASSSLPSQNVLVGTTYSEEIYDQKNLKLIRKVPSTTTEVYPTSNRDVGIFIDGVPAIGYKDTEFIEFGKIDSVTLTNKGNSYEAPPFILINERTNLARCTLSGSTIDQIEILTEEAFSEIPTIRITSGEGAVLSPVVTAGAITSMNIINPGRFYSSPPIIRIVDSLGKGAFAEFEAVLDPDGSIADTRKISSGRFYTQNNVIVTVEAVGRNASATCTIKKWIYDRYRRFSNNLDSNNGTILPSFEMNRGYGYGYLANPDKVRERAYATQSAYNSNKINENVHSPIIGYAYDGNPIYGPYAYSNPTNPSSSIIRLKSGYKIKSSRVGGPDIGRYPLGTFIDDYEWVPSIQSGKAELDENNGRFCVTPDYPDGTYAYFITVSDSSGTPAFPYILGKNFYSLPVDSNYNSLISQDDIPAGISSLETTISERNGFGFLGQIQDVKSGNVKSAYVESSTDYFSPENDVFIDNKSTGGTGAVLKVAEVTGKHVESLESTQTKAVKIQTTESAYLFEGDLVSQLNSEGSGVVGGYLIGDVINSNTFVLRDVTGAEEFKVENGYTIKSETLVQKVVLDVNASFTIGSTIRLTNDDDEDVATGIILESTNRQNSLTIKVDSEIEPFFVTSDYYLRSSTLSDTNRAKIISVNSLSSGLTAFQVDDNIAIVETNEPHNLGLDDEITVSILPDDDVTTTTFYVRKRLYQKATALAPLHSSTINDNGLGSGDVLLSGVGYSSDIYEDVELIFQDSNKARQNIGKTGDANNARATIVVSSPGNLSTGTVTSVIITDKGFGYRRGDILTVRDTDLNRNVGESSTQRFTFEVTHVGFSVENTLLTLSNVTNISADDFLQIGPEIVKVVSVDVPKKSAIVERGQRNTTPTNHFYNANVTLIDGAYRFNDGFRPFGEGILKPYLLTYDGSTQEIFVGYDYSAVNPLTLAQSSSFFDDSIPRKLVQFKSVEEEKFNLEFSNDNITFNINPIIDIQKYYRYTFDVSHISMVDTFLDFSASSNYNVFTQEKETSGISPGNPGSFITIKLGFGPATSNNDYQSKKPINFQNYFYFIKVSPNVNTNNSYLRVIDDPLTGVHKVSFVTSNRFVYSLNEVPAYDGSGLITYTTSSPQSVGKISRIRVINTGENYNLLPIVKGVSPTSSSRAIVDPVYDQISQQVVGFNILDSGNNYSNAIAVVKDGDGSRYEYDCVVKDGKLTAVNIIKKGSGFTYKPTIEIIESDLKIYLESDNIGIPKNVKINATGRGFNSDKSQLSKYSSPSTFILRDISDRFFFGEKIYQDSTGATAIVANNGYREGSNLLKVIGINGIFENGATIRSSTGARTATLFAQVSTEFTPDIRSYINNFGYYTSDKGKLSNNNQRLQDSYFYQDYSYVLRSKTSIDVWRELIKETVHPAGFQLFGEMVIDSKAESNMPERQPSLSHYSFIELPPVTVSILQEPDTYKRTTTTIIQQKVETLIFEDGIGGVSVDTFDTSETNTYDVILTPEFDGDFDPNTGQLIGTTEFVLLDKKKKTPLVLTNQEQLFITLDGINQEPGVAYTISGNTIKFSSPPFGRRIVEGQELEPVRFYGRAIKFKNSSLNERYFRKVKNISNQFDGVQFEFDLFWENGSIVKTDQKENLIVALNGVVQKARQNEREPFGNSYSIIRSENPDVTDKIRFSKPPIDNEDLYGPSDEIPEELKAYEKCFIYTIGNYERLTINSDLYEYRRGGPYLIQDEVTNVIRKIDDSSYALVYIDGVLQREGSAYQIVGPNITFTEPLKVYVDETKTRFTQDVNIILLYGRDIPRTLTFYEFEPHAFFNSIVVTLSGDDIANKFISINNFISDLPRVYYSQGDTIVGKLLSYSIVSPDEISITFTNPSNVVLNNNPLTVNCLDIVETNGSFYKKDIDGTYDVSYYYKVDEDGNRVLERSVPPWLYGLNAGNRAWSNRYSMFANLVKGDKILIDGESSYRTIVSTPDTVSAKDYRSDVVVQNEIYAQAQVTDYNGETLGVGLSINANVNAFGSITTLDVSSVEWNQRDLELYFNEGILLQPTAYQYYSTPEIYFIPVDGNGGGAKAEVIAYGGQILDVVLTDGGSGYTQPPKVVVARKYKRIKESARKVDTLIRLGVQGIGIVGSPISSVSEIIIQGDGNTNSIFSVITFGGSTGSIVNSDRKIASIVETKKGNVPLVRMPEDRFPTQINLKSKIFQLPTVEYNTQTLITQVIGGIAGFESNASIQQIDKEITNIILIPAVKAFRRQLKTDSINGVGTFLDAPLSLTDTIAYVGNTFRFPDTPSRIRIGREVIFYRGKESDRFTDLIRGYQGTIVESHRPGDLVLHDPEFVTLLSGGITTVITEVSVAQSTSLAQIQKTVIIESISQLVDVELPENYIDLRTEHQFEVDQFDPKVIKQVVIIPPTSYNVITEVHSSTSTISVVTVSAEEIAGFVSTSIVTPQDTQIQLTSENQIELVPQTIIESITIGSVASTATSSSNIVTTSYEATYVRSEVTIDVINTISTITSVIVENADITISSMNTSIVGIIETINSKIASSITVKSEPMVMYYATEVQNLLQDVDTITTRFTLLLGGTLTDGTSLEVFYKEAFVDYVIEDYVLTNEIILRDGSLIILDTPYNEVIQRNGSSFFVDNRDKSIPEGYETFTLGNVGNNFSSFENNMFVDSGISSGLSLLDIDTIYPYLSIEDFEKREYSALFGNGDRFNLGIPSYQQPVTISQYSGSITSSISVENTQNFKNSGYLFTSSGNVIQYTSKTSSTFEGCTLIRGSDIINTNDEIIPFSIV